MKPPAGSARLLTAVLAASGWIALAATRLPALSPLRVVVVLSFVALCPGAAVMRIVTATRPENAGRYEPMTVAVLTVGTSVALTTLVSEGFFLSGHFTMPRCVVVLSVLTSVLALVPWSIERWRPTGAPHR